MNCVYLRHPVRGDGEELTQLVRISRALHRGWASPPATVAQFKAYLRRSRCADFVPLLVCRDSDQCITGAFNLSQIFYGSFKNAYLGYWVGAPFAKQGYMRGAMPLVLKHAFGKLKLHRLEANIQPGNEASRALVRRQGFRLEGFSPRYLKVAGRWRDHERWALTTEEWRGGRFS